MCRCWRSYIVKLVCACNVAVRLSAGSIITMTTSSMMAKTKGMTSLMEGADYSENVKLDRGSSNKVHRDRVSPRNKTYGAKLLACDESLRVSWHKK